MKTTAWVALLNLLALYGMWYITYWRYDLAWAPVDSQEYTDLTVHLWEHQVPPPDPETGETPTWATRPLRYRLLTPALARGAARVLPFYRWYNPRNPKLRDQLGPEVEPLVYYLVLLNYFYLVLASALLFHLAHYYYRVPMYLAYAGSLWFLTTFYNLLQSYPPHSDAGCHLLIALALVAYHAGSWRWFVLATLLGALQKETVILIVGLFLALELLRGRWWGMGWMLACGPALVLYKCLGWYWPVGGLEQFDPSWQWLTNLGRPFWPETDKLSFVMRHLVGNLPFFAALAGHVLLRWRGQRPEFPWQHIWMFPLMFALGLALDVNLGRVVSMGSIVYLLYELKVAQAWFERLADEPWPPPA